MGAIYGRGAYGDRLYSRSSTFADLVGNLTPSVTFRADLTFYQNIAGDLRPSVTLDASKMDVIIGLIGGLTPSVKLGADMWAGPLWGIEIEPPPPWTDSDLCEPVPWEEVDCGPPQWVTATACEPLTWTEDKPAPSPWKKTEPCVG
jgi:hypothetical protein